MALLNSSIAMDRHLEVLHVHQSGGLLIGAGSLTGRLWTGSFWFFDNPENAPDAEKCAVGMHVESGVTDLQWINDYLIISGYDSGGINIWKFTEDLQTVNPIYHAFEHDDMVKSLSVAQGGAAAVSGGYDCRIKVWDIEEQQSSNTFQGHSDAITCVACHPRDSSVFLSSSQDGNILLWDTRNPKPAQLIEKAPPSLITTCLSWQPDNEWEFAMGDEFGTIVGLDLRQSGTATYTLKPHTRSVHKVAFDTKRPNFLASVSEDCSVVVTELNPSGVREIYRDTSHTDFVRGVSWCQTTEFLYTCGWDSTVKSHDMKGRSEEGMAVEVNGVVQNNVESYSDKVKCVGKS
ncbi:methylosome protein 50 [Lingula anatina]|uniref:Methylosome protein 50 n=1 Tax=Lingula anatina TaxID=7574 RepID=A0A1S3IQD0_LINAN|nr:methylosome protein 50 [Lingula anatina]|eukprot:XP_013400422.1 methylosome protein 50 [Lingula anatina]